MCVRARINAHVKFSTESGPSGSAQGFRGASYFALNISEFDLELCFKFKIHLIFVYRNVSNIIFLLGTKLYL